MPVCPACGQDNPDGFKFCGHCSSPLADQPGTVGAEERKIVSVLFCDVVGFTAASEQADPEDVRARMQPYYTRLRRELEAFEGTVQKFIGDAVMAVFGAPVAHEDDAERAVRAGLRILEAITELNDADPTLELSVRVGVNTGEVVVTLAPASESEAAVLGDAINTAARIQTAAPVNGVAVGEETFRATERIFEYEPLEPVCLEGKSEPVRLWRALAARARFGSDVIRSMATPLVGRETDLKLLQLTFDKSVRERSVQLVTVVGEPGVGKSRLVAELFTYVDELPELVVWRQGRCLPYGDGITFWALSEIVKAHAGIYESDSPEQAGQKLDLVLPEGEDTSWLRARLLPLLGVESGATASREESFTAWRRFLEHIAEQGPCVLVIEDLHWADEALLAFLEHLADWAQDVPLLIVCTARPELYERAATWSVGLRSATTISLSPLSRDETARLIGGLLDQAVLPAETQQVLLERAGGNPLYAEEFVRMLRERELLDARGSLRSDVEVPFPSSIQALIAARLDTLTTDRKTLLQDAAVIGKVFWTGALCSIGERDRADVELALHELARKELIRPARQSSMEGEQELGFWHILVRDVAYSQIPRAQRAQKHLQAANWLEAKAGDRVEDLAEVLAYHTDEALQLASTTGDDVLADEVLPLARRYTLLAGERALGLDANQALHLLERALALTPDDHPERPVVLSRWAESGWAVGKYREAATELQRAIAMFQRESNTLGAAAALATLASVQLGTGDPSNLATAERAVALAETQSPGPVLVKALSTLGGARWIRGDHHGAVAAAERALEISRDGYALAVRGLARCDLGDAGGVADVEEAVDILIGEGRGWWAAIQLSNLGYARWQLEGPATAAEAFATAEKFAAARGTTVIYAVSGRISALVETGAFDEALAAARAALDILEGTPPHGEVLAAQARALAERADGAASEPAESAREVVRRTGRNDYRIPATVASALVQLNAGRPQAARQLVFDLTGIAGVKDSGEYGPRLPALVRCTLAAGDTELAAQLVDGVEPTLPVREHALVTTAALLAEARGEYGEAAAGFADAASRWDTFGARLEQAYALLGRGRCLAAMGEPRADKPLRAAHTLFSQMGARPRVEECERLIAEATALSS